MGIGHYVHDHHVLVSQVIGVYCHCPECVSAHYPAFNNNMSSHICQVMCRGHIHISLDVASPGRALKTEPASVDYHRARVSGPIYYSNVLTHFTPSGMMSQYTVASLVGKVIDVYGPSICSLVAGLLFSSAFGGFATQIYFTPDQPTPAQSTSMFRTLTFAFLCAGLGTVFA